MSITSISSEQIHDLQLLLMQRYSTLHKQVDVELHVETDNEVSITTQSDSDWTIANQETDDAIARVQRDADELVSVEAALRSIRNGTYGSCCDCGGSIDYPRLVAYPTATRCLPCQEKFESRNK
jgi:DnaK suppressor protein